MLEKILLIVLAVGFTAPLGAAAGGRRDETGVPLEVVAGERLMVDARVNGRPVKALLDSAAEATLIDPQFAREIGLGDGAAVKGQGSGASTFEAQIVGGVTLSAVGVELRDQEVAVTDLADVGRRLLGQKLSVVLGREIFDAARLEIDVRNLRIRAPARTTTPRGRRLALVSEHGVETIPVSVEGHAPVRATFDLGNGSQVLVSRRYAERLGVLADGRPVKKADGGGLGGASARDAFSFRTLKIAGRTLHDVEAAVDPQDSASDLNVGMSVLRHFLITTDFHDRAVWLQPFE